MDFNALGSVLSSLSVRQWNIAGYSQQYANRLVSMEGRIPFGSLRKLLKIPAVREVALPSLLGVTKTAAKKNRYEFKGWVKTLKASYGDAVYIDSLPIEFPDEIEVQEGLVGFREYQYIFETEFLDGEKRGTSITTDEVLSIDDATQVGWSDLVELLSVEGEQYKGKTIDEVQRFQLIAVKKFKAVLPDFSSKTDAQKVRQGMRGAQT